MVRMPSLPTLSRVRTGVRRRLESLLFRLETTQYLLDRPVLDYQPLPWAGVPTARLRGDATLARWSDMRPRLPPGAGKTAVDVGCCYGFFTVQLAELGYQSIGVDLDPRCVRIARLATPERLRSRCSYIETVITPEHVPTPAAVDCTLALSVWHHWVQAHDLERATGILRTLWERTRGIMFFESGEGEVIDEFKLPFTAGTARAWLTDYLRETCAGGAVELIGEHRVGQFAHYADTGVKRGLFTVTRPKARL
jgi:2-polyprenyl-3-methyl-5-hydroxy-6-metoxy-1,4-benzoquinol methylase